MEFRRCDANVCGGRGGLKLFMSHESRVLRYPLEHGLREVVDEPLYLTQARTVQFPDAFNDLDHPALAAVVDHDVEPARGGNLPLQGNQLAEFKNPRR